MKPLSYPDGTCLISGTWDPEVTRREKGAEGIGRTPFSIPEPCSLAAALRLLRQDTPCLALFPCEVSPNFSVSFPFFGRDKALIPPWQRESHLMELIGTSLCLTDHSYTCLFLHLKKSPPNYVQWVDFRHGNRQKGKIFVGVGRQGENVQEDDPETHTHKHNI